MINLRSISSGGKIIDTGPSSYVCVYKEMTSEHKYWYGRA